MTVQPGARAKSPHYQRVEDTMRIANQMDYFTGDVLPTIPPAGTRKLRAKLIFEEAMETINALGVEIVIDDGARATRLNNPKKGEVVNHDYYVEDSSHFDLIEVIDGCADIIVVTTGTMIACGVADVGVQAEVDRSNLDKFPNGVATIREDGKYLKPPGWKAPDIAGILLEQGARPELVGITVIDE